MENLPPARPDISSAIWLLGRKAVELAEIKGDNRVGMEKDTCLPTEFNFRRFVAVVLLVSMWVSASEAFRGCVIVMPALREHLSMAPGIAPMDWGAIAIWGVWDMFLTAYVVGIGWLFFAWFGRSWQAAVAAGSFAWAGFFLLFWLALHNLRLSPLTLILVDLPLAWIETVVAVWLTFRALAKQEARRSNQAVQLPAPGA